MVRTRYVVGLLLAGFLASPSPALAQLDQPSWGITAGFAPFWKVPEQLGDLFDADTLDLKGHEFRIGLIRGTTFGGEWGVTLVHKRLSKESIVAVRRSNDVIEVRADDAEMLGVEIHRFFAFARAGRAQIGLNVGGGLAQMRGFLTGSVDPGDDRLFGALRARGTRHHRLPTGAGRAGGGRARGRPRQGSRGRRLQYAGH